MKHNYFIYNHSESLNTSYAQLEKEQLILEVYQGEITLKDANAHLEAQLSEKGYNPEFDIISDLRDSVISILINEIPLFVRFFNSVPNPKGNRKLALLMNTPNHQIYLNILLLHLAHLNIDIKIFTCVEKALRWLGKSELEEVVNENFANLKKQRCLFGVNV